MRTFVLLASLAVLVTSEPPTSYSSFSSGSGGGGGGGLSFQNVPSVASLQYSGGNSGRPSSSYGAPSQSQSSPSSSYGAPSSSYGAPSQSHSSPSSSYGAPSSSYNSPSSSYGAPSSSHGHHHPQIHSQSQPANVQISYGAPPQLPPGSSYGPPPVVTGAGPDHEIEYRVVYKPVKAPKPDLVLPPPPPKQKTIVYILVPRIEPPEPIIVPTHAPTPPSKPEVYFIRYKAPNKNKIKISHASSGGGGGSSYGVPSTQYGAASAPKPVVVEAPQNQNQHKKREAVASFSSAEEVDRVRAEDSIFGERVKDE